MAKSLRILKGNSYNHRTHFAKSCHVNISQSPFFTVITASLNNGATIGKTLESVGSQRFQSLEHIVIDGKSNDGTPAILKKLESSYNLTWQSEQDKGLGDALNKGVRLAQGRYIIVIQADDQLISSDVLAEVFDLLKDETADLYSFPVIKEYPGARRIPYNPIRVLWWHRFKTIFPHQGCFVHRRLYARVGEFKTEISIGVDYDFFYRAMKHRPKICFGNKPVALMGGGGISSNDDFLRARLKEEFRIQNMNEQSLFWRFAQRVFKVLYLPYKTWLKPKFKRREN